MRKVGELTANPDYIVKFIEFLSDTNWEKSLLDAIKKFIYGGHSLTKIERTRCE